MHPESHQSAAQARESVQLPSLALRAGASGETIRHGFYRVLVGLAGLIAVARADDGDPAVWPQFRGPTGQGLADGASLPTKWSEKDHVVWKTEVPGLGHSSPVVCGDQVWVTTASTNGSALGAVGIDLASGKTLHSLTLFRPQDVEEIHQDNSYASPTPVIETGRLYCHFGRYGTACVDTASGEVLWTNRDLVVEHQGGPGSSPVLCDDLLIVNCDGADAAYVVALDKQTGQIRWKRDRSAPFRTDPVTHRAFSTPLVIESAGRRQVVSPGADQLQAYDAQTGEELWHVRYVGFSTVPCPVGGDGTIYFCTGFYEPELWAVRTDGSGDVTESHVVWKFSGAVPDTPSPILVDGRIYLVSNTGVGTVVDAATGKKLSQFRLGGNYSASPLYAGGRLYFCSHEGLTRVVEPGDRPKVIIGNRLAGEIKASPAVAGNALLIRTDKAVYRIEEGRGGE
jgi:outer membrane protein assembly factor BamB